MSANIKSSAKKVASVTLAGMMALGTLPAAAIAEEANNSVETQSVSEVQDFEATGTKVTKATINGTEADSSSAAATGETQTIVPTEITTASGTIITLTANSDGTYTGSDGWTYTVSGNTASTVGTHRYTVTGTKDDETKSNTFTWTITTSSLSGLTVYNGDDTSDTTFTYDGSAQTINFILNGTKLTVGTDIDVTYMKAGTSTTVENPTDAGNYVAVVTGRTGTAYEGARVEVAFTINKLDLSTASVSIADTTSTTAPDASSVKVNGQTLGSNVLKLSFESGTGADGSTLSVYNANGSYTYTVSGDGTNVTGSAEVTFNKVSNLLTSSNVQWNNGESDGTLTIDLDGTTRFDASKVTVTGTDGKTLSSSAYTLVYEKYEDGNWVSASASDLDTAGTYRVSVKVNASANGYTYGGVDGYLTVNVGHESSYAEAYVTYNGNLVGSGDDKGEIDATYDGSDVAAATTIKVTDEDGNTLTKGTDYDVTYYTADGTEVDSITDAGEYQIRIVLKNGWKFQDGSTTDTTTVVVSAAQVSAKLSSDGQLNYYTTSGTFYAYTGEEITPTVKFYTTDSDDNETEVEVPASAYKVTYTQDGKTVSSLKDKGDYTLTVADASDSDNYEVQAYTTTLRVSDEQLYTDVANDAWYAQVVADAKNLGYMSGYAGTNWFGPEDTFTRAQAACVLYNMAKADDDTNTDAVTSDFSDVTDPDAYYYTAVAWAEHTGVIHGYGDGTFRPDQAITREEFAAMLANYASITGESGTVDTSVLDAYDDASSVDDWAKESVAWAVANGIMGNGGFINPTGNITRAETAAMSVNFYNNVLSK